MGNLKDSPELLEKAAAYICFSRETAPLLGPFQLGNEESNRRLVAGMKQLTTSPPKAQDVGIILPDIDKSPWVLLWMVSSLGFLVRKPLRCPHPCPGLLLLQVFYIPNLVSFWPSGGCRSACFGKGLWCFWPLVLHSFSSTNWAKRSCSSSSFFRRTVSTGTTILGSSLKSRSLRVAFRSWKSSSLTKSYTWYCTISWPGAGTCCLTSDTISSNLSWYLWLYSSPSKTRVFSPAK